MALQEFAFDEEGLPAEPSPAKTNGKANGAAHPTTTTQAPQQSTQTKTKFASVSADTARKAKKGGVNKSRTGKARQVTDRVRQATQALVRQSPPITRLPSVRRPGLLRQRPRHGALRSRRNVRRRRAARTLQARLHDHECLHRGTRRRFVHSVDDQPVGYEVVQGCHARDGSGDSRVRSRRSA